MEERAVAQVLEDVRRLREGRHPDPLHAFAAHVGDAQGIAVHEERHPVAADAGRGHGALGYHRRAVVRAARAEVGLTGERDRLGPLPQRLQQRDPRRDRAEGDALLQTRRHELGDAVGVELAVGGHQRPALFVQLAHDARPLAIVVEHVADEELAERALLLDHEDLLEPPRELAHDPRLHREEHADLEQADAVVRERRVVEPELAAQHLVRVLAK